MALSPPCTAIAWAGTMAAAAGAVDAEASLNLLAALLPGAAAAEASAAAAAALLLSLLI